MINSVSFGTNYQNVFKELNIKNIFYSKNEEEPKEFKQSLIRQIFCYLINIILSFTFYKIETKKKSENDIFLN